MYREAISLADNPVHERKREPDGQFVYQERQLPAIAVLFKAEVRLSCNKDAITATREALRDEQPAPSPCGVIVSVLHSVVDEKGNLHFWDSGKSQRIRLLGMNNLVLVRITYQAW